MLLYDVPIVARLIKACNDLVMPAQLEISCEYDNRWRELYQYYVGRHLLSEVYLITQNLRKLALFASSDDWL
jgi:hypothetical protein